ncbi:MAG: exo-alpha-sialidase [Clostridia bacterium]|nr:exo-alpha-sialidase [Clostridia bacterium]
MMKRFWHQLVWIMAATLTLTLLFGCGKGAEDAPADETTAGQEGNTLPKISEYTLVWNASATEKLRSGINAFLTELDEAGTPISVMRDSEADSSAKLLLVGDTTLPATAAAKEKLSATAENSYVIAFEENTIAIVGNTADATMVGMKYFLMNYVVGDGYTGVAGDCYVGEFGDEVRIFSNLSQWTLEETVVIDKPPADNPSATLKYPSIIELQHQPGGVNNGMLYATGERWIDNHMCPIYCSADGGSTWAELTEVKDTTHRGVRTAFAPCLYELPVQVGEMPAGTLILGANSIDTAWRNIYVVLYRSYDLGVTWEAFATVGASEGTGGYWEANFACTDDGTLICYFSDDTDSFHSQKLVLRYTKDGENWSDFVETVALDNGGLRAGMPVVTKMGNGQYFMAYEIVGMAGNPVYYKITDDPLDWGDPADTGKLLKSGRKSLAATPWCTWIPAGGECGTLIVTGWRMATGESETGSDIFLSFDYGRTWTTMDNYYDYEWYSDNDTWGYSTSMFFSQDGETLYYMANPKGDIDKSTWYTLYKIKVQ